MDCLSIIIPAFGTLSFILFIVGMMMIGSGRKMINQAVQRFLAPKAEEVSESSKKEVISDETE